MSKLSELVRNAISDAETKIASARDVTPPSEPTQQKVASAAAPSTPTEKRAGVTKTAAHAIEIANALDNLALLMPKIASGPQDRAGPAITSSDQGGTAVHTKTKATTLTEQEASTGGGSSSGMHLQTNKADSNKTAALSPEAAEEILLAKVAQSQALIAVGRAKEAQAIAAQAQADFERAKKAYEEEDASTRTPSGNPKTVEASASAPSEGAPGGVARDNAGFISMTQRDAKIRERGPISQHVSEPAFSAKSDRGIQDNFENTAGAKIAQVRAKIAAKAKAKTAGVMDDEAQYIPTAVGGLAPVPGAGGAYVGLRRGEATGQGLSGAVRGATGNVAGNVVGGGLGALVGGAAGLGLGHLTHHPDGAVIGATVGGAAGAGLGSFMGGAHGANMATRSLLPQKE